MDDFVITISIIYWTIDFYGGVLFPNKAARSEQRSGRLGKNNFHAARIVLYLDNGQCAASTMGRAYGIATCIVLWPQW